VAGFFLARLPVYPPADDRIGKSLVPAVAAVTGWIETMKMPLREIHKKYTRSEMTLMGWRSGEIAANMHSNYGQDSAKAANNALGVVNGLAEGAFDEKIRDLENKLGPELCAKLEGNEDLDLRKLTGPEALRLMHAQGIKIMPGFTREATSGDDALSRQVKEAYKDYK
jgi:hypothetical protein